MKLLRNQTIREIKHNSFYEGMENQRNIDRLNASIFRNRIGIVCSFILIGFSMAKIYYDSE